jgi:hypothetical protein
MSFSYEAYRAADLKFLPLVAASTQQELQIESGTIL